ncbi:BAG molecular chaperone regulator 1, partial [Haplosporangium sp. Z 767]
IHILKNSEVPFVIRTQRNSGHVRHCHNRRENLTFDPTQLPTISSILSFLWRLTPAFPKHLFQVHHEQYDPETVLNIRWNHEKYTIDFQGRILGQVKLGELRTICKDLTDIPLGGLTLLHGEATLKDENAPLSCFGIKPGARIIVKGVKPTPEQIKELTTNGDPEEYALILRISGSLEKCKDFVSEYLPKYEQEVESYLASKPGPFAMAAMPPGRKKLHDLHGMMSESLLQSLLALDGVTCQPEFEVARVKRREAVKETQKLLDVIDAINARVKENDKAARL